MSASEWGQVAEELREKMGGKIEFVGKARHYGLAVYIERSKSKGFHVWAFFPEPGVLAWKARRVSCLPTHP